MSDLKDKYSHLPKDELIVDLRTREEYAEGHVPGAKNIPHDEIENHLSDLKKYKAVYMHCLGGGRAGRTFDLLTSKGLTNVVCVADSGMKDWIAAGYPISK